MVFVAAGHEHTAEAAVTILREGGNAFDAVVAAHLAACVVEPVFSSLAQGPADGLDDGAHYCSAA